MPAEPADRVQLQETFRSESVYDTHRDGFSSAIGSEATAPHRIGGMLPLPPANQATEKLWGARRNQRWTARPSLTVILSRGACQPSSMQTQHTRTLEEGAPARFFYDFFPPPFFWGGIPALEMYFACTYIRVFLLSRHGRRRSNFGKDNLLCALYCMHASVILYIGLLTCCRILRSTLFVLKLCKNLSSPSIGNESNLWDFCPFLTARMSVVRSHPGKSALLYVVFICRRKRPYAQSDGKSWRGVGVLMNPTKQTQRKPKARTEERRLELL